MESPAEAAEAAPSFSRVVFTDIPYSYPPAAPITCTYTLCDAFQPSSRDWVGIFKVGWSSTKDYHTFVWVEQTQDVAGQHTVSGQAVFKEYYLPKDDLEFYQFCYVDGGGQVKGASTPFCFRLPAEPSAEGGPDEELLVITTQEQVEQSVREKAELQSELDRSSAENKTLKAALQREQQQIQALKEDVDKKAGEMSDVVKELRQSREAVETLESSLEQLRQENRRLKEEMLQQRSQTQQKQQSESLPADGSARQKEAKYERAVMKINQQKEELAVLRGTIDLQSEEIATLNAKVREGERELSKTRDCIQLQQVDLQTSEKDKARLKAELQKQQSLVQSMEEEKKRNQELSSRLPEVETVQSLPDEDLKDRCQALGRQLDEARAKLAAEREESKNLQRKGELLDRELQHVNQQLEKVVRLLEQEQRKSGKAELQLTEILKLMAEKDMVMEEKDHLMVLEKREKEELHRENEALKRDNEGLRRNYAALHRARSDSAAAAESIPSASRQNPAGGADGRYGNVGPDVEQQEEESLVCHLCQESFPGITPDELQLHQQSHRLCPFCGVVCDAMEQSEFEDHVYSHEL
ncbi:calcium-binding and coiled-coil domain-containing protein 2 isoform X2 [Salarias fasciatus]|uniref:calcium-binding and coiled-coil domain-containing protein 2 isoform X2 n=1 Tax=Salarias fasciatus TaxID=181472 RepID=UPI001176598D|nr:calcium-binding and coiled-coil domain-containing protein 2 isoform X2 [Salarias fasciatus]